MLRTVMYFGVALTRGLEFGSCSDPAKPPAPWCRAEVYALLVGAAGFAGIGVIAGTLHPTAADTGIVALELILAAIGAAGFVAFLVIGHKRQRAFDQRQRPSPPPEKPEPPQPPLNERLYHSNRR